MRFLSQINTVLGHFVSWFALAMVLLTFSQVIQRYLFQNNPVWQGELVMFLHGIAFLSAAGWCLQENRHVRVDILYEKMRKRRKTLVDAVGAVLYLLPVCVALLYFSWDYVRSSWQIHEASREFAGMQGVYVLKTFLWVFPLTLIAQGAAMLAPPFTKRRR